MSKNKIILYSIFLTVIIEIICLVLRYGFGLESSKDTASTIGMITFGIRVHHGYVGLILLVLAWVYRKKRTVLFDLILICGLGLFLSDIIHHFFVLWPIEGSPNFDMFYD